MAEYKLPPVEKTDPDVYDAVKRLTGNGEGFTGRMAPLTDLGGQTAMSAEERSKLNELVAFVNKLAARLDGIE